MRRPKLRTAYGPRKRRAYVDDKLPTITARESGWQGFTTRTVPMPHGGQRELVCCPWCSTWCARLYLLSIWGCRRCLGLRYRSQYEGRRIEADPTRVEGYERRGGNPARARAARELSWERETVYHKRRILANLQADLRMLGIIEHDKRHRATEARYRRLYRAGWRAGQPVPLVTRRHGAWIDRVWDQNLIDPILTAIQIDLDMLALYDMPAPIRIDQLVRSLESIAELGA